MNHRLKTIVASSLVALLLGVQGLGSAHELSDAHHELKERCAFCLGLERMGPTLVSMPPVNLPCPAVPVPDSDPVTVPRVVAMVSTAPRGPPA